jgi:hypothetical protein
MQIRSHLNQKRTRLSEHLIRLAWISRALEKTLVLCHCIPLPNFSHIRACEVNYVQATTDKFA